MGEQTYMKKKAAPAKAGGAKTTSPAAQSVPNSAFLTDGASRIDLPEAMRSKMESAYGTDLSAVKVYQSQRVADGGAEAVTMGNTIAFAPGKFDMTSQSGQALLGHEMSHVVSQSRGEVQGNGVVENAALETRADREGAMAAGEQVYSGPVTAPLSSASPAGMAGPMQCKKASRMTLAERQAAGKKGEDKFLPGDSTLMRLAAKNPSLANEKGLTLKKYRQRMAENREKNNDDAADVEMGKQAKKEAKQEKPSFISSLLAQWAGRTTEGSMVDSKTSRRGYYETAANMVGADTGLDYEGWEKAEGVARRGRSEEIRKNAAAYTNTVEDKFIDSALFPRIKGQISYRPPVNFGGFDEDDLPEDEV